MHGRTTHGHSISFSIRWNGARATLHQRDSTHSQTCRSLISREILLPRWTYSHSGSSHSSYAGLTSRKLNWNCFPHVRRCVIAELFLEGQPIFTSPQLLSYRKGEYDPTPLIERISDKGVQRLVKDMIQLEPGSRRSAEYYLEAWYIHFSGLYIRFVD